MTTIQPYPNGYLELIIGCMFSGKTSALINIYKKYKYCGIEVCVVNHDIDNRYTDCEKEMSSHDKITVDCLRTDRLENVWDIISDDNIVVILINEAQFFPDLDHVVRKLIELKKIVYVSGLDGDYKHDKIGQVLDLIPICDKVSKLNALCSICKDGTQAIFSKRITKETEQIVVGVSNYIPVCRTCYNI